MHCGFHLGDERKELIGRRQCVQQGEGHPKDSLQMRVISLYIPSRRWSRRSKGKTNGKTKEGKPSHITHHARPKTVKSSSGTTPPTVPNGHAFHPFAFAFPFVSPPVVPDARVQPGMISRACAFGVEEMDWEVKSSVGAWTCACACACWERDDERGSARV